MEDSKHLKWNRHLGMHLSWTGVLLSFHFISCRSDEVGEHVVQADRIHKAQENSLLICELEEPVP